MKNTKTQKGAMWRKLRKPAVAAAIAAAAITGTIAGQGSAHAATGWGGRVAAPTTVKASTSTASLAAASSGWGG